MKFRFLYSGLVFLIFGCKQPETGLSSVQQDSVRVVQLRDSLQLLQQQFDSAQAQHLQQINELELRSVRDLEMYQFTFDNADVANPKGYRAFNVVATSTPVLSGPDANSDTLLMLNYKHHVWTYSYHEAEYLEVEYERYKKGFVKTSDLSIYRSTLYPGKKEVTAGQVISASGEKGLKLAISDYRKLNVISETTIPYLLDGVRISGLSTTLKNCGNMLCVMHYSEGEKQQQINEYYYYHNERYKKAFTAETEVVNETYVYKNVYLPMKMGNRPIRHRLNGDHFMNFNLATGKLNSIDVSDTLGFARGDIVAEEYVRAKMVLGDPGYEAYKDEHEMAEIVERKWAYYFWNGHSLESIKMHDDE